MIPLLADENFHGAIVRGLRRKCPELDLVRVHEIGMRGARDEDLLEWATQAGRVLITHDADTLIGLSYERVHEGRPMPGVLEVKDTLPFSQAIDEILIFAQCSHPGEWECQVCYIPI